LFSPSLKVYKKLKCLGLRSSINNFNRYDFHFKNNLLKRYVMEIEFGYEDDLILPYRPNIKNIISEISFLKTRLQI